MNWIKGWFNRLTNKHIIKNRKVTKARFLYLYVIIGAVAGLGYFITALFLDLPKHWAFTPIYLLVSYAILRFVMENWKLIWRYINDRDQGNLLLYLNKYTHFEESHKLQLIKWVYLRKREIRSETRAKFAERIYNGEELSPIEKIKANFKQVYCPQQLRDGHNLAFLVNALIYAHKNIQVLDPDLRDILDLTDDHMLAFDLNKEMDKMKDDKHKKYLKVGKEASERLKK